MSDPVWLKSARKYIGQKEVAGLKSNAWIIGLWQTIPWIWSTVARKDDSVLPWCGAFIRLVMVENKIVPPKKWWSAREWATWGMPLHKPLLGCIGVMRRTGGGHVGIIVGRDNAGNLLMIGGNQGDSVNIAAFNPNRFTEFVWPRGHEMILDSLPILSAALSVSEA
jgi:uncharacterized protein (TIGR02594 family)